MYPHDVSLQDGKPDLPAKARLIELVAVPAIPPASLLVGPEVSAIYRHQIIIVCVDTKLILPEYLREQWTDEWQNLRQVKKQQIDKTLTTSISR